MSLYQEKNDYFLNELNLKKTSAADFYRDIFPVGSFENELGKMEVYPTTKKGNGFIVYTAENNTKHTRMVFDDLKSIFELQDNECAFMSPISYFGKNRTAKNARQLFALAFDLDEVGRQELHLLLTFHADSIPRPTYIVNSGGGIHLYYVLKEPMPMTPTNQRLMKELKFCLTSFMWNSDTSRLKDIQYQALNQGFRLVGSKTKKGEEVSLNKLWNRRQTTKFNGVSYITQKAAEAVYSEEGQKQIKENINYYMNNAKIIREGLIEAGYTVYGGINAPYIWLKVPEGLTSWEFFDKLLKEANVVGTPGVGFGPNGEGYFRLTAFGTKENTEEAIKRIKEMNK